MNEAVTHVFIEFYFTSARVSNPATEKRVCGRKRGRKASIVVSSYQRARTTSACVRKQTMAREMTPVPATPASHTASHIGARDELVRLLNAHANNDLLAYHLLPLVRDLNHWGNCSAALEAIIGAARYTLTSVWGLAYDIYYNQSDYGSD